MIIPQALYDTYTSFADDMLLLNFGQNCKLIYPDKLTPCENCYQDSATNKSSNVYKPGGPQPFTFGFCGWCGGDGFLKTEKSDTIKLRIYHDKKYWTKLPINIEIPDGTVQVFGFMTDLPKIQMANSILLHLDAEGYSRQTYVLFGEPHPHGLGPTRRYFIAYLKRE